MSLFIAISGCGGGNRGPQDIYKILKKKCPASVKVLSVNTIPNDIQKNVEKISKIAQKKLKSYENIYLIGYSMGGTIAILTAQALNKDGKNLIKGMALLATETSCLSLINELNIPIMFYHGTMDSFFPIWQIEPFYQKYPGSKKMIRVEGVDHSFAPSSGLVDHSGKAKISQNLLSELLDFFHG